jgi:crotonobetainyl-CoA:carnitine CoA-transferase CaiB-like acyl-CoA transferase
MRAVRRPLRFSGSSASELRHAPRLGEHGEEVLREAGLGIETIAAALGGAS